MIRNFIVCALMALVCLFGRPAGADNLTICAVSGHAGNAEAVSFVGATGNSSSGDGFAAFYLASGHFIDGSILSVDVHEGGVSKVEVLGYLDDVSPVLVELSITDQSAAAAGGEVDDAKVSVLVRDGSGVLFDSEGGDNQYGWITRRK